MSFKNRVKESQMALDQLHSGMMKPDFKVYLPKDTQFIAKNYQELRQAEMALDAGDAVFNTISSGVPNVFTTAWTNEIFTALTQKYAFREIGDDYQQGDFASTTISFPTISNTFDFADYDDFGNKGQTNVNANWEVRDIYQYQTTMSYGDLEQARMGAAKIDVIAQKREAAALGMTQVANNIFFNGKAGKNVRGLLNDVDLNPAIALPVSAANPASSKFKYKTYEEIVHDIILMFNSIVAKAGNNVNIGDRTQKMKLCLYGEDASFLVQPNIYGRTALEWINTTFPGLEIVTAQQYFVTTADSGNKAQLIIDKVDNKKVVRSGFSYQFMAHRVVALSKSYSQDFSEGIAGALITLPLGIATATGV